MTTKHTPGPWEKAVLRLRHAADADEYLPTEKVIDTVLARLAAARAENELLREALVDIREWAKHDDVLRYDDGDISLADYCARALHRSKP